MFYYKAFLTYYQLFLRYDIYQKAWNAPAQSFWMNLFIHWHYFHSIAVSAVVHRLLQEAV